MSNTEQLRLLVQLGEQVRELAEDLGLDTIAFMAGMVVAESKWAHYQSMEDDAPEPRICAVGSGIDSDAQWARGRQPGRQQGEAPSNVTHLLAYRKALR
jgi:hypothetical protein